MIRLCRQTPTLLLALTFCLLFLPMFVLVLLSPTAVEESVKNQVADVEKFPVAPFHRQLLNVQRAQKNCSCSCTISCSDDEHPSDFFMSCAGVNQSSSAPPAPPIVKYVTPSGACGGEARSGAITGLIGALCSSGAACVPFCMKHTDDCEVAVCTTFCMGFMSAVAATLGTIGGCAKHNAETTSCFPGDATVLMQDGTQKVMAALAVRDMVAVRKGDGTLAFEDIYAFGHKDTTATAQFFQFTLTPINANVSTDSERKSIELTALHLIPVPKGKFNGLTYKRAKDIVVGDRLWVQASSSGDLQLEVATTTLNVVTSISLITKQGLYNPFTLGGTIIVNGVVASTHSDWFLDSSFELFNAVGWLPTAYQLVLLPVRMLYYGLGKDVYAILYERLDALVDISELFSGRKLQFGGLGSWITVTFLAAIVGRFVIATTTNP